MTKTESYVLYFLLLPILRKLVLSLSKLYIRRANRPGAASVEVHETSQYRC